MEKQYKPIREAEAHRMFRESFHAIEDLKRCECGKPLNTHEIKSCEGFCQQCYDNSCGYWIEWKQSNAA